MSQSVWVLTRYPVLQLGLAFLGTLSYCIYARSWRDMIHLVYDIPANVAVFAFIAQVVLECIADGPGWHCGTRFALIVGMTVVCAGRDFAGWGISGHLSCVLAVALVQMADSRLPVGERLLYWIPLPIVLAVRWWGFDEGQHWQTYHAVVFGVLAAAPVIAIARLALLPK